MAKDPAFLFYSADFMIGIVYMTNEQVGKYIKLLCLQHQNGGPLTNDEMMFVCGSFDKKIFDKFIKTDDDRYFNERLSQEIDKRKKYSESRQSNRLSKSNNDELSNICQTYDKDMSDTCKSYENHMVNENTNSISIVLKDKKNTIEDNKKTDKKPDKKPYGQFQNVMLTDDENEKVIDKGMIEYIESLSNYKESKGKRYKSDYATICQWKAKNDRELLKKSTGKGKVKGNTADYPDLTKIS